MKKKILTLLFVLIAFGGYAQAQDAEPPMRVQTHNSLEQEIKASPSRFAKGAPLYRWYAGIELGMPLGVSTFTSFAPNGGLGFQAGVLGGYRYSPLLSAEVSMTFGRMKLGTSKCCEEYFMGVDAVRYLEYVAGMDSYSYKDIHSSVSMQQYAIRVNVDMLQIMEPRWDRRWSMTISPAIYGIGSRATLKTNESKSVVFKQDGFFRFGLGVGIGGSYQLTENLGVGLRTGTVWVLGKRYDGIAPTDHKGNMIWNNTLTLTWEFWK